MNVHHICTWWLRRPEEGIGSLRNRARDGCELLCGCLGFSSSPVGEPPALFYLLSHLSSLFSNSWLSASVGLRSLPQGLRFLPCPLIFSVSYLILVFRLHTQLLRGIGCVPSKKPPEGSVACEHSSKPPFTGSSACTKLHLRSFVSHWPLLSFGSWAWAVSPLLFWPGHLLHLSRPGGLSTESSLMSSLAAVVDRMRIWSFSWNAPWSCSCILTHMCCLFGHEPFGCRTVFIQLSAWWALYA